MNWVDAILSRIEGLWPWKRVMPWQMAVRSTFLPFSGVRVSVIGPGIVRALWFFDSLEIRDVQEDTYNLPTQSVTTSDDVGVCLSANFVYEIVDVQLAVLNVRQFDASLQDLAMVYVNGRCREMTWAELRSDQKELERTIKETLTRQAEKWGVKILRVGLTDVVKARQWRMFGDPVMGAN